MFAADKSGVKRTLAGNTGSWRRIAAAAVVGLGCAAGSLAGKATISVSAPGCVLPAPESIFVMSPDGLAKGGTALIDPVSMPTAMLKRNALMNALLDGGVHVRPGPSPIEVELVGLSLSSVVTVQDMGTGDQQQSIRTRNAVSGTEQFPGHFDPFDRNHQPAIFTAGIVTDVGALTVQISAAELNFQTDGPIICQALFQRLAPRAPQYGTQINYAGDRLEVYFDPAYTVTQGGIIFGTTSRMSQGCTGSLVLPSEAQQQSGDMDGNGVTNNFDIDPFVMSLLNPIMYEQLYPDGYVENADANGDGVSNNFDIDPFVQQLLGH